MAAERYLSRRIPDLRVGNNIDKIDKKPIPSSNHPYLSLYFFPILARGRFPRLLDKALTRQKLVEKIKILLTYELNERSKKENNLYKMIIIYK